jgi:hypothetical protein
MNLTCVSGYWNVKNKHDNKFYDWFNTTLKINCPYVFFCSKSSIDIIKKYRGNLPTYFIECDIEDFYMYKYKQLMKTHPIHCPSQSLNLIWNEKIFMIQKAIDKNPFNSEYFMWVDAGICIFRNINPPTNIFPNNTKLETLPKDKFIYSSSYNYDENKVLQTQYYHHITGTYIIHKNFINTIVILYKSYLNELLEYDNIWTDQVVLTHIYKNHKDLFYKLCHGYGEIINFLY